MKLKKQITFIGVFSIAAGAMISSGIFILPGLAFAKTGPSVFLSYLIAGVFALIGTFSLIELSTAMPKAGGDCYYVTRSLGPLSGTISGILSWVAISLKSAFAIYGIAEVIFLITGIPLIASALTLTIIFTGLNIYGVKETIRLEIVLVLTLISILIMYSILGIPEISIPNFDPFIYEHSNTILITAGFVFVSFGGLNSVTSIAEEVKNPKRNLPLGIISAVIIVTAIYVVVLIVTVGILPANELKNSLTPIADTARHLLGDTGYIIVTIGAIFAFITTAIAGIMSASRYPFALAKDKLIPNLFTRISEKTKTPVTAIIFTGILIGSTLLLPLNTLVKAASTVILAINLFANIAVIILRESRIQNYQPSFKTPFYPWLPIISIIVFAFFIIDMGLETIEITLGILTISFLVYFFYGRRKVDQEYALLHLIDRITDRQLASGDLETELREILRERDKIKKDWFDHIVHQCKIIIIDKSIKRTELFDIASEHFSHKLNIPKNELKDLLHNREEMGETAISQFAAIPHILLEEPNTFDIMIIKSNQGISFSRKSPKVKGIFIIAGSRNKRNDHLRALAAIAGIVQEKGFQKRWQTASSENQIRDLILLSKRKRH